MIWSGFTGLILFKVRKKALTERWGSTQFNTLTLFSRAMMGSSVIPLLNNIGYITQQLTLASLWASKRAAKSPENVPLNCLAWRSTSFHVLVVLIPKIHPTHCCREHRETDHSTLAVSGFPLFPCSHGKQLSESHTYPVCRCSAATCDKQHASFLLCVQRCWHLPLEGSHSDFRGYAAPFNCLFSPSSLHVGHESVLRWCSQTCGLAENSELFIIKKNVTEMVMKYFLQSSFPLQTNSAATFVSH